VCVFCSYLGRITTASITTRIIRLYIYYYVVPYDFHREIFEYVRLYSTRWRNAFLDEAENRWKTKPGKIVDPIVSSDPHRLSTLGTVACSIYTSRNIISKMGGGLIFPSACNGTPDIFNSAEFSSCRTKRFANEYVRRRR